MEDDVGGVQGEDATIPLWLAPALYAYGIDM